MERLLYPSFLFFRFTCSSNTVLILKIYFHKKLYPVFFFLIREVVICKPKTSKTLLELFIGTSIVLYMFIV